MDEITPVRPSTPPAAVVIAPDTVIDFKNGGAVPQPVSALGKAKQKPLMPSLYTQPTSTPKDTPAAVSDVLRPGDPGTHLKGRGSSRVCDTITGVSIAVAAFAGSSCGAALSNTVGQAIMQATGHAGYDIRSGALDGLVGGTILTPATASIAVCTLATQGITGVGLVGITAAASALGNNIRATRTDVAISAGASAISGAVGSALLVSTVIAGGHYIYYAMKSLQQPTTANATDNVV